MNLDVTVVVRHVDERTLPLCRHLLERFVPSGAVIEVSERPFSRAVRRTFEAGIQHGRAWTLAVDADVLVHAPALEGLCERAREAATTVFEVQPRVIDKLFGGPRYCGVHLFRTKLLPEALAIAQREPESIRPESLVIQTMDKAGYPFRLLDDVVGLHDYEQAYRDLYRKAFVHALKHRFCVPHLASYWSRLAPDDPDLQVCLWGLRAGQIFERGPVDADARRFPDEIDALLGARGWSEKEPLAPFPGSPDRIARTVMEHEPPTEYDEIQSALAGSAPGLTWSQRVRLVRNQGAPLARLPAWILGVGIEKLGNRMRRWAQRRPHDRDASAL